MDWEYLIKSNDYILNRVASDPNKIFIKIDDSNISYNEFNNFIYSYMQQFSSYDSSIKRLLIDIEGPIYILSALCACNRLNIVPIIMPSQNARVREVDYYKISQADYTINNNCIVQENPNKVCLNFTYKSNDIQCVLFTSGTETSPKAVELTFENMHQSALSWSGALNFNNDDKYLNILPIYHISGLAIFFRCIYFDLMHIIDKYDIDNLSKIIASTKIKFISVVPKIIIDSMSSKKSLNFFKKLENIIIGGDKINRSIFDFCKNNNVNAYISYGMTETASGVSGYFVKNANRYLEGYIGTPHKNVTITLKDSKICIKGKSIMKRYVGENLCNGMFISNDSGESTNNKIQFTSRNINMIISGGENINLKYITDTVRSYLKSNNVLVIGFDDHRWGEIPVLVYEQKNNSLLIDEVIDFCHSSLPKHMIPKHFIEIDNIPYKNKQIDYKLLNFYIKASM